MAAGDNAAVFLETKTDYMRPFFKLSSLINDQQISLKLLLTELFKTLIPHCLDILRQRATDVDVKKYFVDCLEQVSETCLDQTCGQY